MTTYSVCKARILRSNGEIDQVVLLREITRSGTTTLVIRPQYDEATTIEVEPRPQAAVTAEPAETPITVIRGRLGRGDCNNSFVGGSDICQTNKFERAHWASEASRREWVREYRATKRRSIH